MLRQGDLLIKPIDEVPTTAKKVKGDVVIYGEASGHSHRLLGGEIFKDKDLLYLLVAKEANLIHDEHKTIRLPKGKFAVIRQREYQSKDMVKIVQD